MFFKTTGESKNTFSMLETRSGCSRLSQAHIIKLFSLITAELSFPNFEFSFKSPELPPFSLKLSFRLYSEFSLESRSKFKLKSTFSSQLQESIVLSTNLYSQYYFSYSDSLCACAPRARPSY